MASRCACDPYFVADLGCRCCRGSATQECAPVSTPLRDRSKHTVSLLLRASQHKHAIDDMGWQRAAVQMCRTESHSPPASLLGMAVATESPARLGSGCTPGSACRRGALAALGGFSTFGFGGCMDGKGLGFRVTQDT